MIQFSSLRLSGFKSFVDKTELDIGTGLNGIVGPNGCGKSNLVEALRWVMGESSAKRMRGSGMEDVIFAGSGKRSKRNFAEVSLILNNKSRQAPSAYNSSDEIEVIRKIERDKGSGYKINGKHARARDVQMLFADTVTGANSPSLVSQGHVTRMIGAKPQNRRLILEESAGISGLYARRHEAELRLKAADTNLLRVEDISSSMESRLNSLKRQARQASKYKNLAAQIRQIELLITYLEWQNIINKQKEIKDAFASAESIVSTNLGTVTQLTKTQNTQIEELPPLRKKEADLAAILQRHKIDLARLESESKRYKNELQEAKTQLHQTNIDSQHEEHTLAENIELLTRIDNEHKSLLNEQKIAKNSHTEKEKKKNSQHKKVIALENLFTSLKENAAETRAREDLYNKQIIRNQSNMDILIERKKNAVISKNSLVIDENTRQQIKELEHKTEQLDKDLQKLNEQTDTTRKEISRAEENTDIARQSLSNTEKLHAEFNAEISMLEKLFQNNDDKKFAPILDNVITDKGFEKALSRALGDCLNASIDKTAATSWNIFTPNIKLENLPNGAKPLLPHVNAPKELSIALSQIGVVESQKSGDELAPELKAGQSLVSKNGFYWRWDGYHASESATDMHSLYLEQKNKLIELEKRREAINTALINAQNDLDKNLGKQNSIKQFYNELLLNIKTTEGQLKELHPALQKIKDKNLRIQSENKRYEDQIKSIDEDILSLQNDIDNDNKSLLTIIDAQNNGDHSDKLIEQTKSDLGNEKNIYQTSIQEFISLEQAQSTRNARIQAIADERISLNNRSIRAKSHFKKLTERREVLSKKLFELENNPINNQFNNDDMINIISDLDKEKNQASELLSVCENEIATTNKALKDAENTLGQARESRAASQAMLASMNEQLATVESKIEENLNIKPNELIHHAAMDLGEYQTTDLPKLKQDKEQLTRERDTIGAVNLRADEEVTELEKELTTLLSERNDLMQAIDELRGAIAKINREAKLRLDNAFDLVNTHFQRLFQKLFDGGKAYLKLVNSDDPLDSGLEIYAQPPGKALQSLSLLSGGEQTLTSIALIFAMFLTNPSPICVLDEIDAPLDDANVDRVCNLLDEIAARGETRFLVITHHRLTMARMDRLYGITMSEQGISQLVSVDLQQSFDFIDKKVA